MKFLQSLDPKIFKHLEKIAKPRGISVQELLRAVVVPEWISKVHPEFYSKKRSEAMKKGWETRRKNKESKVTPVTPPPWETPKQ